MLELELISTTAAASAGFIALPITELKVNIAPMLTDFGLEEEDETLEFWAKLGASIQKINTNTTPNPVRKNRNPIVK